MDTMSTATTTLNKDEIKEMIHEAKLEILHELQQDKSEKKQIGPAVIEATKENIETIQDRISEVVQETQKKIYKVGSKIIKLMVIKGLVDKIENHLRHAQILIILKTDQNYVLRWEETRNALSISNCVAGAVIVAASRNSQGAKEYCYPPREPIECSLVGLYHEIMLELTSQQVHEDNNYDPQIFRDILDKCEQHEFCMKIFVHAVYGKPKMSSEVLRKLHSTLQVSPKSLGSITEKMLKFSYNNLPEEYKSCLLYLAIFPPGHCIRRSALIGRWVVEGLITREDWSTSVRQAEQCFDVLINQWLVYPADIGPTGKVNNCKVGHRIHEFITKIAKKQHIVETRLSHHLARRFSIFNDLRIPASDTISNFLQRLSESSQFTLLKVLDLEGCQCFGMKNKHYLKDMCCKIKLLKYLSLRGTNVIQLPNEINNLHELEVLDIRQTKVPPFAVRNVRILKLKRLLAGHGDPRSRSAYTVAVPEKIQKMENMELLSRVRPRTIQDLKDVGTLWQLRKLGVAIEDKDTHLMTLLEVISNLNMCIRSLSITLLPQTRREGIPFWGWLLPATNFGFNSCCELKYLPKVLESLRISGTTQKVKLLQLLLDNENSQPTKITLSNTSLSQDDLEVLSKLPMLCSIKLRYVECTESKLTFKMGGFKKLKYFLLEGSNITEIIFDDGATGMLEKIVLPLNEGLSLSGLNKLPRLEELELNNSNKSSSNNNISNNNDIKNNNDHDKGNGITSDSTAATTNVDSFTDTTTTATTPTNDAITTTAPTNGITTATAIFPNNNTAAHATDTAAILATTDTTAATNTATATVHTTDILTTTNSNSNINNMLFSLFDNAKRISKVTLQGTMLKQGGLQILAKNPNIRCLILLEKSYDESWLTFNGEEFPKLNLLIIECSNITKINFAAGSCANLKKFIWTFTNMESLSGFGNLPRLKELEFNGEFFHNEVIQEINKHKNKPYFTHYKPENKDQTEETIVQRRAAAQVSCFGRGKGWRQMRK